MRGFKIAGGIVLMALAVAFASPAPAGVVGKADCSHSQVTQQVNTQSTAATLVTQGAATVATHTVTTPSTYVQEPDQFIRVPGALVEIPGQTYTYETASVPAVSSTLQTASTCDATLSTAATNTLQTNTLQVATDVDVRKQLWRPAKFATWRANRDAKKAQTALLTTTVAAPAAAVEVPRRRHRLLTESVSTAATTGDVRTHVQTGCDLGATE